MRWKFGTALAVGVLSLTLGACSGASDTKSPATEPSASAQGVVKLSYWSWGTGQDEWIKAFNQSHPNIQVTHTDAGGGTPSSAKLQTATRAKNAPDAAAVEYTTLPAMIVGGVAADITPYVADQKAAFTDAVWGLTRFNGAVYGVPQDIGPMTLTYNQKRLKQLGVPLPKTWAEFATAAEKVHKADSKAYLTTFSPAEFGFFAGMSQQAGAKFWDVQGEKWTVGIASKPALEVADYWQKLIDSGSVKAEPLLTPQYNSELNAGKILSWPAAVWAPGVISGVAPKMVGDWAMGALPQWTPGDNKVAYQGGSAIVVTTSSKHPREAAEFATWMNASPQGTTIQVKNGQYPASLVGQKLTLKAKPPTGAPQQTDFWQVANSAASNTIPSISWGPDFNVANSAFSDAMSSAINKKTSLRDALIATQAAVIADMKKSGFDVSAAS